jgi:hypothetical protein
VCIKRTERRNPRTNCAGFLLCRWSFLTSSFLCHLEGTHPKKMIVRQEGAEVSTYRETETKQTERRHAAKRKIVSDLAPTAHIRQVARLAKEHEPVDHRLVLIAKVGPAEDLSSPRRQGLQQTTARQDTGRTRRGGDGATAPIAKLRSGISRSADSSLCPPLRRLVSTPAPECTDPTPAGSTRQEM